MGALRAGATRRGRLEWESARQWRRALSGHRQRLALLTFELKVSGDSGRALKMAFQDAWDRRRALADSMRAGGDREAFMEGMMILQGELAGEIVNILDADQLASFNELKQRRTATNRGGGGGRRR